MVSGRQSQHRLIYRPSNFGRECEQDRVLTTGIGHKNPNLFSLKLTCRRSRTSLVYGQVPASLSQLQICICLAQ